MRLKIVCMCALAVICLIAYAILWYCLIKICLPFLAGDNPLRLYYILTHWTALSYKSKLVIGLTGLAPLAIMTSAIGYHKTQLQFKRLFGDSHFATFAEIKKMRLLEKGDILVGWKNGRLLRAPLTSHLLVFAPSRSGKGVSQVIPNALSFKDSLLVVDIKHEIFDATSGFRAKHGQEVFLFSPANLQQQTHCYNPLDFVSSHPSREIADLQRLIEILIPCPPNATELMWIEEARSLALGLLLWMKESGQPFTLGNLNKTVKGTHFTQMIGDILKASVIGDNIVNMHPIAYMNLNNFYQKAEKEKSGVKSSLTSKLTLWDDPMVVAATSKTDFDIRQLRKEKMTIYLGIPTNQLERLAPLMNLFVQQFLSIMTENLPDKTEPYRVLVILDEFCNLGRMEKLRQGLSFLAGYNVHLMPVIQTIGEFNALYGRDSAETFFQNTDYKISYRQNSPMDKEFISKLLGSRTVKARSNSKNKSLRQPQSHGSSDQWIERPLLSPDEVGNLPKKNAIAILSGFPPVKFKKIIYYEEALFKKRLLPKIAIPKIEPLYPMIEVYKSTTKETNTIDEGNEKTDLVEAMQHHQSLQDS